MPFSVLRRAAELAMVHGNGLVRLGSRQEIVLGAIPSNSRDRVRRELGVLLVEHHPRHPNIVTTRPGAGRSGRTPWLSDGAYEAILTQFVTPPALPVNFSDPRQGMLPLHTGQINFVATPEPQFWQVSFNARDLLRPTTLSMAIHSEGVAAAAFVIQHALLRDNAVDLPDLHSTLEACLGGLTRNIAPGSIPSYEAVRPLIGFCEDDRNDACSLGISALNQPLPGQFLVDLGLAARAESIATAGITPWQSLVIHGIPPRAREHFERLLLRHKVATAVGPWERVCFNDLRSPTATAAGASLLASLNENFPHPGSLRIGLTEHGAVIPDTPIVVQASVQNTRWPARPQIAFKVYVRENFERFGGLLIPCGRGIGCARMIGAVEEVIERYGMGQFAGPPVAAPMAASVAPAGRDLRYRCVECHTEYSEHYGDPLGGVEVGTPFEELPDDWQCPTCGAPGSTFKPHREFAA